LRGARRKRSARVAAHPVEEERREPVGELVGAGIGPQPGVGPVDGREREERGRAVVEIGAQLAPLAAFAEERAEALLVPAALCDEAGAALAFEVAPLADEDGRNVELLRDDPQVAAERGPDPLDDRTLVGNLVEGGVERLGAFARDLPEEVGLALDVRVERALLDAERLGEVADRCAVIALLREEAGGGAG
jgi:hypothetical protein